VPSLDHPKLAATLRGGFGWVRGSNGQRRIDQVAKRPHTIRDAKLYGWREYGDKTQAAPILGGSSTAISES